MAEFTTNSKFIFDGEKTVDFEGKKISLNKNWQIKKSTQISLDLYYKDGYQKFTPIAKDFHIKCSGSITGELNYVLHEASTLLGAICMRPEEVGAVVSLINGAGGIAVDHEGNNLSDKEFSSNNIYPLLAGNKKVVKKTLALLEK